jgi:cytoskeletal protein CcmA (bactofilin family)
MAKNNHDNEPNGINIIGTGTIINGDINSNGDIRIDGSLTGKLLTKGKVVIGATGRIKGEINCKNSDVEGLIEGKITVSQLLSLKATSQITGDIIANKLAIEPGCRFTGNCDMSGSPAALPNEDKPKKEEKPAESK